jgi:hypothetical protein
MRIQMSETAAREIAQCYEDLRARDAEIGELKTLLTRAADALEEHVYVKRSSNLNVDVSELIDELRKAAQ